jgi:methylthioribose-1-phosphate isomerase
MMQYLDTDHVKFNETKDKVIILDQAALPNRVEYLELSNMEEMYDAIYKLQVRGAPCIGIFAGYAITCLAKQIRNSIIEAGETDQYHSFYDKFKKAKDDLNSSRPTAVNLSWALNRMEEVVTLNENQKLEEIIRLLEEEAVAIHEEDIKMCLAIAENGLKLVKDGDGILTHCNAGPLATSRYGTALGPILLGKEREINLKVFSDETRPLLQGARLTCYELQKASVDVTLICDNMASIVMKNGWIQACFVGCDRIAANGDAANKVGTSGVAILAKHYHIPFYVLGPTSTIDRNCKTGKYITIELRNPEEIKEKFYKESMALKEVKCYNPAFDVTDHELITAIITDKGIFYPPYHFI